VKKRRQRKPKQPQSGPRKSKKQANCRAEAWRNQLVPGETTRRAIIAEFLMKDNDKRSISVPYIGDVGNMLTLAFCSLALPREATSTAKQHTKMPGESCTILVALFIHSVPFFRNPGGYFYFLGGQKWLAVVMATAFTWVGSLGSQGKFSLCSCSP